MNRAFLTGITGQDGGYLAERLLADGWDVHGLVHAGDAHRDALTRRSPGAVLHEGDLGDADGLSRLVHDVDPDAVVNLGGISSVALSWREPVLTGQLSGLAVAALLDACQTLSEGRDTPVRFLQASSAEIFGNPAASPQDETTPLAPVSPYGAAKAFAHHLVGVYRGRGLAASTVILYNHESPRRPETFVTRKITSAAVAIAAGRQGELVLGNLDARRDWGWAPDYVDAMLRAVQHDTPDDYVVATGVAHTVADFVAAAFAAVGITDWQPLVRVDPEFVRPVDAVAQIGDASRARDVLGWAPTVGFDQLVSHMVEADRALL